MFGGNLHPRILGAPATAPGCAGSLMAQLSNLLLFDPDPIGLDILTFGLEKEGCSVTGTGDPARAHQLLQESSHSLLLLDLRSSEDKALDLLRSTTTNPRTRNLPCVAIGRADQRTAASVAGAFAFLSVPVFLRDVLNVCRLVVAASVPGSRPSADAELFVNLGELGGVYFLVRALAVMGRSSVVEVRHGAARGELRFTDGLLSSAEVGSIQGPAALHRMMLWEDAVLRFRFKNVVRRGSMSLSTKSGDLLEECERFLRDFAHEARELGSARTRYAANLDGNFGLSFPTMPGEVVPLLKLFDGHRDLAQILDESPFRIFDTLKVIQRFVSDGAIALQTSPRPPPPPFSTDAEPRGGPGLAGPDALHFWLQKRTRALGTALAGQTSAQNGSPPHSTIPTTMEVEPPGQGSGSNDPPVRKNRPKSSVPDRALDDFEDSITPPPVTGLKDRPKKPATAVVRGEIKIATVTRHNDFVAPPPTESVVVELDALPPPVPLASPGPPPVTATVTAPAAAPSVIVAPAPPVAAVPEPLPSATGSMDNESKRHGRPHSESFSLVEADFFEREADLYKRESVETFDDLEGIGGPGRKR